MERDLTRSGLIDGIEPVATHEVRGGGGLRLHAREWGNPQGPPLLLIHGLSQSDLCWMKQVDGELSADHRIVTFDLRGHGLSEKPTGPEHYADEQLWADDVAAVIEQTGLERPVVVAWSYGGYVVTDFLRAYGEDAIGAINLVDAAVVMRPPDFDHIGPGLLEHAEDICAFDLGTNIAGIQRFVDALTAEPLDQDAWLMALGWNMAVPPEVRGAMIARRIEGEAALSGVSVPVLVTHGHADRVVLPSMAERILEACEPAVPSWYEGVGHMPFWEESARFDRELAELVGRTPPARPHSTTS